MDDDRRRHRRRRRRPHGDLPHQPGPDQRGVLRGRQGRPGDGRRQHRLGGADVPRARRPSGSSRRSASPPRTCSMHDVLETDLIVLWGTNVANNQPVFTKYLYLARKRGGRRSSSSTRTSSPGLERYWVPSNVESALFGTKLCDLHVPVRPGGRRRPGQRRAQAADRARRHRPASSSTPTPRAGTSWTALVGELDRAELLARAGVDDATFERFVDLYAGGAAAVLVWSMGITQHTHGVDGRAGDRQRRPGARQRRAATAPG